jgi:hypothetical protein
MFLHPIVDEMPLVRRGGAREYGYDVKNLADTLQEQQEKSGRKVVRLPPRTVWFEKKAP